MDKKLPKEIRECNVNYVDIDDTVSITAFQKKMIRKIKELVEKHPNEVRIIAENDNGVLCASLPKKYVHISIGERTRKEFTEDQKAAAADRLRKAREKRAESNV